MTRKSTPTNILNNIVETKKEGRIMTEKQNLLRIVGIIAGTVHLPRAAVPLIHVTINKEVSP